MNSKIKSMLVAALFVLSAFTIPTKTETFKVLPEKSQITWIGKKVTGSHNGKVNLKSGTLTVNGKNLIGGNFVMDMTSIKDADGSENLEGHLKADDFFGTLKYPTSTFVITNVTGGGAKAMITGNLTIKGITKALSFPAAITFNNDGVFSAMSGKITIDRTKYDIKYGSNSFFDSLGDKAIDDNFEIFVKLTAKK